MSWEGPTVNLGKLPPRSESGAVHAIVEIPKGGHNKYEYREELGVIALDRALYSATHYPTDYGFIPSTDTGDGERLDVLVMVEQPTFPGCLVLVRLIGVLTIEHKDGALEPKLLAVPVDDPMFKEYHDIADVPSHLLKEIEHFFDVFKELEGKDYGTRGWEGAGAAQRALDEAIERAK